MTRTERDRRAEVEAWRASGMSMAQFASRRDYSRSSLEKWARAVRDAESKAESIQPTFVQLQVVSSPEVVVEIGGARVRVGRGFDRDLLVDVVAALAGGSR